MSTMDVVRSLAKEVAVRESDSETAQDTYWFIVGWVLDDYEEGELKL